MNSKGIKILGECLYYLIQHTQENEPKTQKEERLFMYLEKEAQALKETIELYIEELEEQEKKGE